MALLDIYNSLFSNTAQELRNRVLAAVLKAATDVINEDEATANHANRYTWATGLLESEATLKAAAAKAYVGVCGNATIQASGLASTDGDIQYTVNSLIDTVYAAGS